MFIEQGRVHERLRADAFNSSHRIWLFAGLEFYETEGGWIFAFKRIGRTVLFALEPLIPNRALESGASYVVKIEFKKAWEEVLKALSPSRALWVGIGREFADVIAGSGGGAEFQILKSGKEPWIDLAQFMPKGRSGRGARAAKNQAIRAGAWVEEWNAAQIRSDDKKRADIAGIQEERCRTRFWQIKGFLNALDPFAIAEDRRYFVARTPGRVEGYLIATQIEGARSFFFEDMMLRSEAQRGVGELLTLEGMRLLQESGAERVSLGVISMTELELVETKELPSGVRSAVRFLKSALPLIYNSNGIELYRKRFKPTHWGESFLALHSPAQRRAGLGDWIVSLAALGRAFAPTFKLNRDALWSRVTLPVRRFPLATGWLVLASAIFAIVNRGGMLSSEALDRFGFTPSAPVSQWLYRSMTSDLLYANPREFFWALGIGLPVLGFLEKRLPTRALIGFVLGFWVFDDLIHCLAVIAPLRYFDHPQYEALLRIPEVGTSYLIMGLLGLAAYQMRKHRDLLLGGLSVALVFGLILSSHHFNEFILHVNYLLFLVIGYGCGAFHAAQLRRQDRAAGKGKTPVIVVQGESNVLVNGSTAGLPVRTSK